MVRQSLGTAKANYAEVPRTFVKLLTPINGPPYGNLIGFLNVTPSVLKIFTCTASTKNKTISLKRNNP